MGHWIFGFSLEHIDKIALVLIVQVRVLSTASEPVVLVGFVGDFGELVVELLEVLEAVVDLLDVRGGGIRLEHGHEEGFDDI